ncbi:hypothetical protein [Corynebacterium cystitidis]|uniref:hypothetical protein n=1 Tax=Corynebacterium cystitidis TaxID=35757 RepID=UPI00211EA097|nr:hypothetical protein [Corynebacterium cystitidis]
MVGFDAVEQRPRLVPDIRVQLLAGEGYPRPFQRGRQKSPIPGMKPVVLSCALETFHQATTAGEDVVEFSGCDLLLFRCTGHCGQVSELPILFWSQSKVDTHA